MTPDNPITQCLDQIAAEYHRATLDQSIRLVRWLPATNAAKLLQTWLVTECEGLGDSSDFFLRCECAFIDGNDYSKALILELCRQYDLNRPDIESGGLPCDWAVDFNYINPQETDLDRLLRVYQRFRDYYRDYFDNIVLILQPATVIDEAGYQQWITHFICHRDSRHLLLMVEDDPDTPRYAGVAAEHAAPVATLQPQTDFFDAMKELALQADAGEPGDAFRMAFIEFGQCMGLQDKAAAIAKAKTALGVATDNHWPEMQVTAWLSLSQAQQPQDKAGALTSLTGAIDSAQQVADTYLKNKLTLVAAMARASFYLQEKTYPAASADYARAAACAAACQDKVMCYEGWRCATLSAVQDEDPAQAWAYARHGLDAMQAVPLPLLEQGTLRYFLRDVETLLTDKEQQATYDAALQGLWSEAWESKREALFAQETVKA